MQSHWPCGLYTQKKNIFMHRNGIRGHLIFVLSVCDSVAKNFNLDHNFRTVRVRDFIFGMHTQLMKPFQMTPRSRLVTLTVTFILHFVKIINFGLCCHRGHSCFTNTPVFFYFVDNGDIRVSQNFLLCPQKKYEKLSKQTRIHSTRKCWMRFN